MKKSEFYQKYSKCFLPDGTELLLPKLSQEEIFYLDEVFDNPKIQGIFFGRRRIPSAIIDIERIKKDFEKLPDFLKPNNQ